MKTVGPIHYRLRDLAEAEGVIVEVKKWYPIAETPHGYWIVPHGYEGYWRDGKFPAWVEADLKRVRKWTPKVNPRTYCPNLKDAVFSFRRRKAIQFSRVNWQMQQVAQVERFLQTLDDSTVTEEGFNCGVPEEWQGLRWE